MKFAASAWTALVVAMFLAASAGSLRADLTEKTKKVAGTTVHYKVVLPAGYDTAKAFPGYMWEPTTAKLQAISKMCVFMYVGEFDPYMWHGEMKKEAEFLRSKGAVARYAVEKGQPHRLDTLAGANAARLFDGFEEAS